MSNLLPAVFVVDDDPAICRLVQAILKPYARVIACDSPRQLFDALALATPGCILLDLKLGAASGMEILRDLHHAGIQSPVIMITAFGSVPVAVESMKGGAVDFIAKPFLPAELITQVTNALALHRDAPAGTDAAATVPQTLACLTAREREILQAIAAGQTTESIAHRLGISARTVDHHRANMVARSGAENIPHLIRLAIEHHIIHPAE